MDREVYMKLRLEGILMTENKIRELSELKLVGFRVLCPGDQFIKEIPKASLLLDNRLHEIKNVINPHQQVGAFVVGDCSDEEDGYWIGVQVTEYEEVPEGMVTITVPPQKYAAQKYEGPNEQIMDAYNRLHKWIEESGHTRLLDKWHLEIYHSWKNTEKIDVELLDTIQ